MSKFILPLCIVLCAISSCCKKIDCVENNSLVVTFHGFTQAEVDTIYTTGYQLGSRFTTIGRPQQLDTTIYQNSNPDSVYTLNVSMLYNGLSSYQAYALNDDFEWKLFIPATGKTINIHNYGYNKYRCSNGCGFRKGDEVKSLSTCSLDGTIMPVGNIRIYK